MEGKIGKESQQFPARADKPLTACWLNQLFF